MVFGKLKKKYEQKLAARRGKKVQALQSKVKSESAKAYQREKIASLEKEHAKHKARGRAPQAKGKKSSGAMGFGQAFFQNAGRQSLLGAPMPPMKKAVKKKPKRKVVKRKKLKSRSKSKYVIIKGVAYKRG